MTDTEIYDLVNRKTQKYWNKGCPKEEILSIGFIACKVALMKYPNLHEGNLVLRMKNDLSNHFAKFSSSVSKSKNAFRHEDKHKAPPRQKQYYYNNMAIDTVDTIEHLGLDFLEHEILLEMIKGSSLSDIINQTGRSKATVCRIKNSIKEKYLAYCKTIS